ncbi:MAG: MGDG synthase family glycosyltransferase [Phycisphaerae bacterium]
MPSRTQTPEGRTPRRILLLSASAGAGHIRAADALLKQFQLHPALANNQGHVEHWDILKYTNPLFRTIYSKLYLDLVNRAPTLLGMVYDSTDKPWKETMAQAFEKLNAAPFISALRDYNPDLIVATHFTPPNIISWLNTKHHRGRKAEKIPAPAIVITDLDVHAMWLTKSYSRYFVSLEESKIYLQQMGIPSDKITLSGIPTDPVFSTPKDKPAARQQLNLHPNRFTILVSAGGFGVGPIADLIEQLQNMNAPTQIIAIAGKSEELLAKLQKLAKKLTAPQHRPQTPVPSPLLVPVGFTNQMDTYMAAADILISKPGGLTTAEAMNRNLPMCIVNPIPGQEERNSDHLLEAGVAIKCNNPPTLAWKLDQLINNPDRLSQMRHNITQFAHPHAAQTIVNTLMTSPSTSH